MKHKKQSRLLNDWLQLIDKNELLKQQLQLCDFASIAVIDQQQRLIYWQDCNQAAFQYQDFVKPGSKFKLFPVQQDVSDKKIKLEKTQGHSLQFRLSVRVFKDKNDKFLGALCWLQPDMQASDEHHISQYRSSKYVDFHGILSRSPEMKPVFQIIQNAAKTGATVLVRGESGSGKELVANAIHSLSERKDKPFLAINCAALSVNLLESELFGHVRGAFTGAVSNHEGLFKRADGGTLFLDEVAEMPLELQAKLLRVIQEQSYIPLGGNRMVKVDVRIVAATHRSLRHEVKNGRFREDLMYRLRVVPIFIPPLRERREDIILLLWHFIQRHNQRGLRVIEQIEPAAMRALLDYRWPGNVRELQNVLEYAFVVGSGQLLKLTELPPEFRESANAVPVSQSVDLIQPDLNEEQAIRQALSHHHGKIGPAARMLGMSRATFWRKRRRYGIS